MSQIHQTSVDLQYGFWFLPWLHEHYSDWLQYSVFLDVDLYWCLYTLATFFPWNTQIRIASWYAPTSQALLLTVTPAKSIRASHWKKCVVCSLLSPARSAIGSYDYLHWLILDLYTPRISASVARESAWITSWIICILLHTHIDRYIYIYTYTSLQILCEPKQEVALSAS